MAIGAERYPRKVGAKAIRNLARLSSVSWADAQLSGYPDVGTTSHSAGLVVLCPVTGSNNSLSGTLESELEDENH